jgi:hypothetical protein
MSDSEEVTRKLPTGEKIVEKIPATTSAVDNAEGTVTTAHVEKKRMTTDGNIKYANLLDWITKETNFVWRSMFQRVSKQAELTDDVVLPPKAPVAIPPAEQAILDLEKTMGSDWYEALKDEFTQPYFRSVSLPHLA